MNIRPFIPLIVAAAVLVGAGAVYGFAYYSLDSLQAKSAALENDIQTKSTLLKRATRARSELSSLESQEARINQYSVDRKDVVAFLEAVEGGGKGLGSTVDVLSVSDQTVEGHGRIALALSVVGSFDAVMRTLGAIEYSPYDGVIENVSLDGSGGGGKVWSASVSYSVGLRSTSTPQKP
jgi:Tfp pilus assembly protein PilO